MENREDRRSRRTRRAIQDAYVSLLAERDRSHITVTDIAERADINRKTFYAHFTGADDVAAEIHAAFTAELMSRLDERGFWSSPFDSVALFQTVQSIVEPDIDLHRRIARDSDKEFFWDGAKAAMTEAMAHAYCEALDIDPVSAKLCARFAISGAVDVYTSWLRGELPMSLEIAAQLVGLMLTDGVKTLPPAIRGDGSLSGLR